MLTPVIYNALVKFRGEPVRNPNGPDEMTKYLTEQKYIKVTENEVLPHFTILPVAWEITPLGLSALSEFEVKSAESKEQHAKEKCAEAKRAQERLEDHANEERRYRTQNKIAIIMPVVTFLLGLFVEHFAGIAAAFLHLFRH